MASCPRERRVRRTLLQVRASRLISGYAIGDMSWHRWLDPTQPLRRLLVLASLAGCALLASSCTSPPPRSQSARAAQARPSIRSLLPSALSDRAGWATDIHDS